MSTGPSSVCSMSSCMAMKQHPGGVGVPLQWHHAGVALAQCSSRQPAVPPGKRLQQTIQVGPL